MKCRVFSVYNKIDLCPDLAPKVDRDEYRLVRRVFISAAKNSGITELASAIGELLNKDIIEQKVVLSPSQAKLRSQLYEHDAIVSEEVDDEGNYHLVIRLPRVELDKLFR